MAASIISYHPLLCKQNLSEDVYSNELSLYFADNFAFHFFLFKIGIEGDDMLYNYFVTEEKLAKVKIISFLFALLLTICVFVCVCGKLLSVGWQAVDRRKKLFEKCNKSKKKFLLLANKIDTSSKKS